MTGRQGDGGWAPVEGGLDVPEEVEGQLLGFILAGHLTVLLVLGRSQRVSKSHLHSVPPHCETLSLLP